MYRYNPLQHPLEIRVIRFGTALAVSDPHLQVTISHVRLDKRPVYRALSYTWGDTTLKEIVECDNGGGQLLITANCASALRRLRLEDELTPIWIDSICINQNDIPERNQQILLISDVYRLASKVQVYLGEEDEDSALGMAYFRDPRKFLAQEEGRGFLDVSAIAEQPKQAVNRILSRAWFGRVWVFQEVLVSSAVDVLCGSDKVTWSQLTTSIWAWGGRNRIFLKEGIKEPPILFRFAEKRNRSSALEILLRYMHEARSSKSTDPRDKIYAMLGIAADTAAGFLPFRPDMNFEGKESYKLRAPYLKTSLVAK
ncbi:Heterokaryon incompatibility protein 6,OR allele [Lachnellula hyalina]|uniref:Heterokaryon incompatibility protein 6,OR allele n=1 Tax=Lachnellula hyalina TaxID=1316788 RepID=A0A8H8QWD7_9HELO|nr:Heterokaryon incompatibility protein 6,OR allele [Lachnellula hyalina]TVY23978.1 Heterokaryon incompatibility protein 6,OR allele [Lachnellula hyalina]